MMPVNSLSFSSVYSPILLPVTPTSISHHLLLLLLVHGLFLPVFIHRPRSLRSLISISKSSGQLEAMEVPARAAILLAVALLIVLPNALVLGRHAAPSTYLCVYTSFLYMYKYYAKLIPCILSSVLCFAADERQHQTSKGIAESSELEKKRLRHGKPYTLQIAGSKLPDCSHACGSCSPCRLVMVSFVCASIQEAETCPMAYKCMCNSKAYPVP